MTNRELSRDALDKIEKMCEMASKMIKDVSESFNMHDREKLAEAEKLYKQLLKLERRTTEQIVKEITSKTESDESLKRYIAVPGHFAMIGANIKNIIDNTAAKIGEGLLFSDRAVHELNLLFEKCNELIICVSDLIETRNAFLSTHIINEAAKCYALANEFSTIHEERLISGVCSHRSSVIYLHILNSLKEILCYYKEIARRIVNRDAASVAALQKKAV